MPRTLRAPPRLLEADADGRLAMPAPAPMSPPTLAWYSAMRSCCCLRVSACGHAAMHATRQPVRHARGRIGRPECCNHARMHVRGQQQSVERGFRTSCMQGTCISGTAPHSTGITRTAQRVRPAFAYQTMFSDCNRPRTVHSPPASSCQRLRVAGGKRQRPAWAGWCRAGQRSASRHTFISQMRLNSMRLCACAGMSSR